MDDLHSHAGADSYAAGHNVGDREDEDQQRPCLSRCRDA